jgi:hypothetical protein
MQKGFERPRENRKKLDKKEGRLEKASTVRQKWLESPGENRKVG